MAVITSNAIGSARRKAGNLVYYVVHGETIARQYQPNVYNPNTTAQQRTRLMYRNAK